MKINKGELRYLDIGSRDGLDHNFKKISHRVRYTGFDPGSNINEDQCQSNFLEETIINKAVHNSDGCGLLYVTKSAYNASLLMPKYDFLKYFPNAMRFDLEKKVEVETISLKNLLSKYINENIFIKIDAQGLSADLIENCGASANIVGIEAEVSFNNTYEGERGFDSVLKSARENGFRLYDLDLTHWKPLAAEQLSGHKGMLIYADALFLPDEGLLRQWSSELTDDASIEKLRSILLICSAYGIYDYFLHARSFFSATIQESFENEVSALFKRPRIAKYLGSSKIMILSSILRDLADLFQTGKHRSTFTTHSMGNRARNPRFRFLWW